MRGTGPKHLAIGSTTGVIIIHTDIETNNITRLRVAYGVATP